MKRTIFYLFSIISVSILLWSGCSKKQEKPDIPQPEKKIDEGPLLKKEQIDVEIPAGHEIFSVVVDDADGRRVRNLLSMQPVEKYGGAPDSGQPQKMTVAWDGKNDKGELVPPGKYRVRGISLPRLKALYDYSWYNPGNPPWEGYKNSGWGGDHSALSAITCPPASANSTWRVIMSSEVGEGGDNIIALDDEGKKVYGFRRNWSGSRALAVDDEAFWAGLWQQNALIRVKFDTGELIGWRRPGGRISEIRLGAPIDSIVVGSEMAVVMVDKGEKHPKPRLVFIEKKEGRIIKEIEQEKTYRLAMGPDDTIYASMDDGVFTLDSEANRTALDLQGLEKSGAICTDKDGNLYIFDQGADQQVKVYDQSGAFLFAIGEKGGQKGLPYNHNALHHVGGVAVDTQGMIWVTEHDAVRRQTMWDRQGKLQKEFIGNATYGASNMALHDQDQKKGFAYGVLYDLDPTQLKYYEPIQYMDEGQKSGNPLFINQNIMIPGLAFFHRGQLFSSSVSGQKKDYYMNNSTAIGCELYLYKDGGFVPVAAILGVHEHQGQHISVYRRTGDAAGTTYFWWDKNEDGKIQENEVEALSADRLNAGYLWTTLIGPDLTFYMAGKKIAPTGFTESGAPKYGAPEVIGGDVNPKDSFYTRVGQHLTYSRGNPETYGFTGEHEFYNLQGKRIATYPYTGWSVHGSMQKGPPEDGQTTGELMIAGVAQFSPEQGALLAWQGNFGQVFFFTEDGIFVSSLFKDTRQNPEGFGEKVEKGMDLTNITLSQEAFGGWFGRQEDGKTRYLFGRNAAHVVEIKGLDGFKRFTVGQVVIPEKE